MRVSIIGTGRIGFSLENDPLRYKPCTHIGAVQSLIKKGHPLEWDYLCDLDLERIQEARKFIIKSGKSAGQKIRTTLAYRDVLSGKPDILIISANTDVHHKITLEAIHAGIPKIVLEKPITLTYRQAKQIYGQAKKTNTQIWINYERRYHTKYKGLRDIIERRKEYGPALFYRGWFASSNSSLFKQGPGNEGALLHDTTHLVDLALFLFGDVKKCDRRLPDNNSHQLSLIHHNNLSGEILTTINNRFFHFEMEIFFERARIKVGNGFTIIEKIEKSKLYKNFTSLGSPHTIADKKMQLKYNPFVNLYTAVLNDEYKTSFLKDACQIIRYLT